MAMTSERQRGKRLKLTDAVIKKIDAPKTGAIEVFDETLPSFGLRVGCGGTRSFFVYQRLGGSGKLKKITLGKYGEHPPALSLADARRQARGAKIEAASGVDVTATRKAALRKAVADTDNTFSAIAARFLEHQERNIGKNTHAEYRRTLTGKSSPVAAWAKRSLTSIAKADVLAVLDKLDAQGKPSASNHALAYLRRFFNWAVDRGLIDHTPADRVRAHNPHTKRDRALSPDELAVVLLALDDDATVEVMHGVTLPPLPAIFRDFYRALILTGQRRGEVAGMTFAEVYDLDNAAARWVIPAARTKNKLEHIVPLAPAMVELLAHRKDVEVRRAEARAKRQKATFDPPSYVFAGRRYVPLSGFSKAKHELDARVDALCKAFGGPAIADWTAHDFRRTLVTGLNELGVAPHVVEAVVNHVSGTAKAGVAGVYNKALYLPERRAALTAWADHVEALEPTRRV